MLEGMKDFVLMGFLCLPIQTNLRAAWGQDLKPGSRGPEVGAGRGPWNKGRFGARGGPGDSGVASQRGPERRLHTHSQG